MFKIRNPSDKKKLNKDADKIKKIRMKSHMKTFVHLKLTKI